MGQEVPVVVAENDVGNDLRLRRILLHLAARPEPIVRAHPGEQPIHPGIPKAAPVVARKQGVPGNDQDVLTCAHPTESSGVSARSEPDLNDAALHPTAAALASAAASLAASDLGWPVCR